MIDRMKAHPNRASAKRGRVRLARREGEEHYRLLVDLSPDAILIHRDGRFIYMNQAAERLFGATAGELIGTPVLDRVQPDYWQIVQERLREMRENWKQAPLIEEKFLRLDGSEIDVEAAAIPFDYEGAPAVQVVVRDISDRKRAEKLQEAVYRIAQAPDQSQTLDDLYQAIHEIISGVMPANNFYISIYDEHKDLITFPYFVDEVDTAPQPKKPRRGLTEYILRTGQSLLCTPSTEEELRRLGEIELIGAPSPIWLGVPLIVDKKTIGVMTVQHYSDAGAYGEREKQVLEFVSSQVARAIERKRAEQELEHRADEFAALFETARDLAAQSELETLLPTIVERAIKLLSASSGGIYLYDPARRELRFSVATNRDFPLGARLQFGEGMAGRVALSRQPMIVDDYQAWPLRSPLFEAFPLRAIVQVPMLYAGELIGVLAVEELGNSARKFSEQDARLLSLFAGQAASAVHNARLLHETRTRAEQLALLYDAGLALNRVLEPKVQLEFLFKIAIQALRADRAEFFRRDPVSNHVRFEIGVGYASGTQVEKTLGELALSQEDDRGLVGWVAKNRVPLYLPDVFADPRYVVIEPEIRSALWVPVEHENQLLGVLGLFSTRPEAFTPQDERLLMLFANQAAVALENARLYTSAQQELSHRKMVEAELQTSLTMTTRLYELSGEILAANTFEETARLVTHTLREGFAADAASIQLCDSQGRVVFQYGVGFAASADLGGQPRPEGLTRRVLNSGVPIIFDDPSSLHPLVRAAGIHSGIAMPLRGETDNLGVLFVDYRQPRTFSEREVELFSLFANQTALALKRVRLLDETRRRADQLAVLNRIAGAASHTLHLDELMETIHREVSAAVTAESFTIALYDAATDELDFRIRIDQDLRLPPQRTPLASAPLMAHLIHSWETLLIKDLEQDGSNYPTPRLAGTMKPTRSWLGVPMQAGDSIVGIICVQAYYPNAYGEEEKQFLATIADQVAVAVRNARLFEETQQRLSELEAINKISTAVRVAQTLEEMLPLLLDQTLAALGTTAGQIGFYDPAADELRIAVARGWFAQTPAAAKANDGIAGQVFASGRPFVTREFRPDAATSNLARAQIPEGWGGAVVPIRAGKEIIGVFDLAVPLPREIQPNEVHLLTTIAEIAGNAVHRMRLHESLEESYLGTVLALAKALDARDAYTNGHSDRLARLALAVAQIAGMSSEDLEALQFAARLHDIGKIGVPDSILRKPAALSEDEWRVMRQHPVTGAEIIQPVRRLSRAAPLVRHHHERFDGTGYPDGLTGEAIPLGARVLAVVDAFSAMIDDRVYRKGRPRPEALAELRTCAGTQFDPKLVEIFLSLEPQLSPAM